MGVSCFKCGGVGVVLGFVFCVVGRVWCWVGGGGRGSGVEVFMGF